MVLAAQRTDEVVNNRLLATLALGLVQIDVALFAVRVALVHDKFHPSVFHFAILIRRHQPGIGTSGRTSSFRVEERIAAVGAEKVQFVITPLLGFSILARKLFILDGNVSLVDDGCAAVEASLGEKFVVVKVTIGKSLVLVKCNVLETFRAVSANKAARVVRST